MLSMQEVSKTRVYTTSREKLKVTEKKYTIENFVAEVVSKNTIFYNCVDAYKERVARIKTTIMTHAGLKKLNRMFSKQIYIGKSGK